MCSLQNELYLFEKGAIPRIKQALSDTLLRGDKCLWGGLRFGATDVGFLLSYLFGQQR